MTFRNIKLESGASIILGKDEKSNDELMKKFQGKSNIILHTVAPGSPFCVIESSLNPSSQEISVSGAWCAKYCQDWRDNKTDVKVSVFTGKDITKPTNAKAGTWKVKKSKTITVKKEDILQLER